MGVRQFRLVTLITDIAILALSFLIVVSTRPAGYRGYISSHSIFFLSLTVIWIFVSLVNGKMHRGKIINFSSVFYRVISSNIIALSVIALLMYTLRQYSYSRTVVLGTAGLATAIELILGYMYVAYKKATIQDPDEYAKLTRNHRKSEYDLVNQVNGHVNGDKPRAEINPHVIAIIEEETGKEMADAIIEMTGPNLDKRTAVISTTTVFNITSLPKENYNYIINLKRINDIPKLNSFFDAVNRKLRHRGFFFCCVETKDQRKARLLSKYPPVLNYIYYFFDFIVKRIFPKLKITSGLYQFLTRGSNTVISRAEALGRLSRAGFSIRQESFIGNRLCIEAMKVHEPLPLNNQTYGPLIALPRIGKDGRIIKVYKLRTMHPYSEFIQEYVYNMHDLSDGGKFRDDFRITSWGRFARRIWLDELPMLINLFKGNMKLVGVRPLSQHYFELYRPEVRERRIRYNPGLIPPYYADMPEGLDEIQDSELRYLNAYDKKPLLTDTRYFFRSIRNIMFHYARSN